MAITQITDFVIFGNATDTKPLAGVPTQSLFFEIDTGRTYKFTGGVWSLFSGDSKPETLTNKTLTTPIIAQIKNSTYTLTLPSAANDTLVGRSTTETLSNKTLNFPIISTISNAGTVTIPTGTRTLVARDTIDTLLTKTINVNSNTITATSQASGDILVNNGTQFLRLAKGTTGQVLQSTASTLQWITLGSFAASNATNTWSAAQTFNDTMLLLRNPANTFSVTLGAGAQTAAKTFTFPLISGSSDTISTATSTSTLTNKTLTSPVISSISNTGTLTLPTSTDTLVGRATTDTLTNKTLTSPIISTISNTGTITLPTATTTLMGRDTTDTVTNKTYAIDSNTFKHSTTNAAGDIIKSNGTQYIRLARGTNNQVLASTAVDIAWTSLNNQTVGTALASGNGSGTAFAIPHSLGSNPYEATIQCSSHSTAFTYVTDATNITVTFVTAPPSGTNNVKFHWAVVA